MPATIYLNGEFLPKEQARLPADERGFFFGDGAYEATRAVEGRLFEWPRHATRLSRSLKELRIDQPLSSDEIEKISIELLQKNELAAGEASIYLQITRGAAPRAHAFPPEGTKPTVFLSATRLKLPHEQREQGIALITTPDIRWLRCDIKSVNLIPAVMAKQAAVEAGATEALFVRGGNITEGAHTNFFAVIVGKLRTHPAGNLILSGCTRDVVLELARELGIAVDETPIALEAAFGADECFITATTLDVMPAVSIDGRSIGNGRPGPVSRKLYEAFAARLYGKNARRAA